jgi:hypothetical protein
MAFTTILGLDLGKFKSVCCVMDAAARTMIEGIWTGRRNFLRAFRRVSRRYLSQYVAMFEWAFNVKGITDRFLTLPFATPTDQGR